MSIENTSARANAAEEAMAGVIPDPRFIPYVQRHEAESLLFAHLEKLKLRLPPSQHKAIDRLAKETASDAPEDINDGPNSAPSKRLEKAFAPDKFQKLLHGVPAVGDIGLSKIRQRCPRFDAWVKRLEALGHVGGPDE